MNKKRAFTLIELLVVIAIIAILAAILFPVFTQAKQAAKKTTAISNLKQMSLAVMMYTNDSDDVFPMGSGACWWVPMDGGWTYDTQPYVKNLDLLRDPSDGKSKAGWPSWLVSHQNGVNMSFVSNGYVAWKDGSNQLLGVMGLNQDNSTAQNRCSSTPWMSRGTTSVGAINNVAQTIAFTERFGSQITWGVGTLIAGQSWWDANGFAGMLPDGSRNGAPYIITANSATMRINENNRNGAVSIPHAGKAVFAMADGHAQVFDPVKTNPHSTARPEDNMWDATR